MPDHEYPTPANAFHPEYLDQLAQQDDPVTAGEAMTGGFWRVVALDAERFGLFRVWENPELGDEPFATLTDRDTAHLAAAFLPLVGRARSFSTHSEEATPGAPVLYRDGRAVGRLRYSDPELTEALNLADAPLFRNFPSRGASAAMDSRSFPNRGAYAAMDCRSFPNWGQVPQWTPGRFPSRGASATMDSRGFSTGGHAATPHFRKVRKSIAGLAPHLRKLRKRSA